MTSDIASSDDEAISDLFNSWRSDDSDDELERSLPREFEHTVPTASSRKRDLPAPGPRENHCRKKSYPAPSQLGTRPLAKFEADECLQRLRKRYHHVVLPSAPRLRKRNRPLCLFVNYLGTRLPPSVEPTANPTDPPCSTNPCTSQLPRTKKRKLSVSVKSRPADFPEGMWGSTRKCELSRHAYPKEPSAYPTEPMGRMITES